MSAQRADQAFKSELSLLLYDYVGECFVEDDQLHHVVDEIASVRKVSLIGVFLVQDRIRAHLICSTKIWILNI